MTQVAGNLAVVPQGSPNEQPFNQSTYISARVLAANTAEKITVPTKASYVRLAGTADFYALLDGRDASVPVDADDGTASELFKLNAGAEWRVVKPGATISVVSAAVCIVTASFYTP